MSSLLLNVSIDGVIPETENRIQGSGIMVNEWNQGQRLVSQLPLVYDAVLLTDMALHPLEISEKKFKISVV